MLAHRLWRLSNIEPNLRECFVRRWSIIESTLRECLVFAGIAPALDQRLASAVVADRSRHPPPVLGLCLSGPGRPCLRLADKGIRGTPAHGGHVSRGSTSPGASYLLTPADLRASGLFLVSAPRATSWSPSPSVWTSTCEKSSEATPQRWLNGGTTSFMLSQH